MACAMAAMLALSAQFWQPGLQVPWQALCSFLRKARQHRRLNEPVTITFAQYSGPETTSRLQQMVDNYMKENPNVTIDLQTLVAMTTTLRR